ncbi:MAG: carbohydrate kinase family protein [bacterium]
MAKDLQVIGLGMCTLDVLMRLKDMPTWEYGTQINEFRLDGGGPVGTAIVAAAKLGARAGFIGTAGTDLSAEIKLRSMIENGVDLSHLVRREGQDDQIIMVFVHSETGERMFSGVSGMYRKPLTIEELDYEYITSAEYLHLDGFHPEAALQAAKWMHSAGKKVVLDGHKTSGSIGSFTRELIRYVDILISGSGFAKALTGISDIYEAGKAVLEFGPQIFVQTEGENGSYTITKNEYFHTPAFNVKVVDTTGAGDVFHGAYIVGLLHGWNVRQIARFSSAVSAIKCTKLGGRSGIPCYDEVISFLKEHGFDKPFFSP